MDRGCLNVLYTDIYTKCSDSKRTHSAYMLSSAQLCRILEWVVLGS